jgi:hypothetical protein
MLGLASLVLRQRRDVGFLHAAAVGVGAAAQALLQNIDDIGGERVFFQ